jgi:aspartate aminotransferase-like enzyme
LHLKIPDAGRALRHDRAHTSDPRPSYDLGSRPRRRCSSDWGSWDGAFNALTASVCRDLVDLVNARDEHVCVPLQGSGTFAVEAALGTLVPRGAKVLVPDNGSYCKRIVRILGYLGREAVVLAHGEQEPADPARIDAASELPTRRSRTSPRCTARPAPGS